VKRTLRLDGIFDEIIVEELEVPAGPLTPELAQQLLEHAMDDCALCREERARTGRAPEPVVVSRPRRPEPERPANWWHGRRKSTRRK
jgi:hypothetical protein